MAPVPALHSTQQRRTAEAAAGEAAGHRATVTAPAGVVTDARVAGLGSHDLRIHTSLLHTSTP